MFNFALINFYEHLKTEVSDIMSLFQNLTTSDQSGYLYSRKIDLHFLLYTLNSIFQNIYNLLVTIVLHFFNWKRAITRHG